MNSHWSKTLEPAMSIGNTMVLCAQEVALCNLKLATDYISMGLKQCQTPLTQKKPEEWVQAQVSMSCEAIEKAARTFQEGSENMMKAMNKCRGECQDMMSHQCQSQASTQGSESTKRSHHRES